MLHLFILAQHWSDAIFHEALTHCTDEPNHVQEHNHLEENPVVFLTIDIPETT